MIRFLGLLSALPTDVGLGTRNRIVPKELNPDPPPASGDRGHQHLGDSLEDAIKSLPHEFGLFGADGRLLVASNGLTERCGSDSDLLFGMKLDDILRIIDPENV